MSASAGSWFEQLFLRATALRHAGRPAEAGRMLEVALMEQPRAWPLWHELGLARAADGRPGDAAIAYRRALRLGGERLAAGWVNLGNALRSGGSKAEAVDAYLTALEIDPALAAAYYNVHAALYDQAAPRAAEAALEQALGLRPNHCDTRFYLAALRQLHGGSAAALLAALPSRCGFLLDSLRFVASKREADTRLFADTFDTLRFAMSRARGDGPVLELGVRHGTTLRFLAAHAGSEVHGFDSFEGLPARWGGQAAGLYTTEGSRPDGIAGAQLHAGWFRDSLPPFVASSSVSLRLLHVDCDLYSSTAEALALLAPCITGGTVVVFDEYFCNPGWQSEEHRAWTEACAHHGWRYRYLAFALFTKQAVVQLV